MTHKEMLNRLGVSKDELSDLLTKISDLQKTLSPNQLTLLNGSLPTLEDAATAFGPTVDPLKVQEFFNKAHPTMGLAGIRLIVPNPGGNEPTNGDS
jgi:hypothetical protein